MSLTDTNRHASYIANGSTTEFSFPHKFLANAHLQVYDAGTLQTITTDYTVTGAGEESGGTVTFTTAPTDGNTVLILRVTPNTQPTDWVANARFNSQDLEDDLDRRAMIVIDNYPTMSSNAGTPEASVTGFADRGDFCYDSTNNILYHKSSGNGTDTGWEALTDVTALGDIGDVIVTSIASGEILKWNGSAWVNNTLAEAGIAAASHNHATSDITSGTFADARIAESNVTQHEAALTITESQVSDLGSYITASSADTLTNKTIDANGTGNSISNIETADLASAAKTGSDTAVVTGTAGNPGDLAQWNADGDLVDGPTPPSGTIVGTTDTQTLTNKTMTIDQLDAGTPLAEVLIKSNASGTVSTFSGEAYGTVSLNSFGTAVTTLKNNLAASAGPTVNDDSTTSYSVGSRWIDTTNDKEYVCLDNTATAAVWTETTGAGGGGGLSAVVDDATPQLAGQLDVNGNAIGDGTLELISFSETASAVNHVNITNAATGGAPQVAATGDDTNVDLELMPKGNGSIVARTDSGSTIEIEAQGGGANISLELTPKGSGSVTAGGVDVVTTSGTQTLTNKTIGTGQLSGTVAHENGGLEADVSAYSGLVKISAGSTSAVTDNSTNWNTAYSWGDHSSAGYLTDVVSDTTPQLGGNLGLNAKLIADSNGNEMIGFTETASAVNYLHITNAVTASGPLLSAAGDNLNVDLRVSGKGTGSVSSSSNIELNTNDLTGAGDVACSTVTANSHIDSATGNISAASGDVTASTFTFSSPIGSASVVTTDSSGIMGENHVLTGGVYATDVVSGSAGTSGNLVKWDSNGEAVDASIVADDVAVHYADGDLITGNTTQVAGDINQYHRVFPLAATVITMPSGGSDGDQIAFNITNNSSHYTVTLELSDGTDMWVFNGSGFAEFVWRGGNWALLNASENYNGAKGDITIGTGSGQSNRLAVGTNDHALVADSAETTGLKYVDLAARTETLSNKSFSDHITMDEIAAPSTPATGKVAIYPKSDGKLYLKDDAGTETDLTGGGGGGGGAGVELVSHDTLSAASSLTKTGIFTSDYDYYEIVVIVQNSSSAVPEFQFTDGGTASTTGYRYHTSINDSATATYQSDKYANATRWVMGGSATSNSSYRHVQLKIGIQTPVDSKYNMAHVIGTIADAGGNAQQVFGAMNHHVAMTNADGFKIYPASGNWTGTVAVYGYKNT